MMNQLEAEIRGVLEAYRATVDAKDVDGFVALYSGDVCIYDMWGPWTYEGSEAWRGMVAEWFGSLGTERVGVDFDEVRVSGAGDFASVHAIVRFSGISAEGKELRWMNNRLTATLRRDGAGGVWKITHQHTSGPIDFETMKVKLQRTG